MNKYLMFEVTEKKPKTSVWAIKNIKDKEQIGEVFWYPGWRRYVYQLHPGVICDKSCGEEICQFLGLIMKERELRKKKVQRAENMRRRRR